MSITTSNSRFNKINKLVSLMDSKLKKAIFNNNISIYKSIVYGSDYTDYSKSDTSVLPFKNPTYKPDISDINQYIDYWVSTFETTIWNYSQPAFELIPNQTDFKDDPELIKFYQEASSVILDKFNDPMCNFKISFNGFIRDWFELGMGVLFVDQTSLGDVFVSIPPEMVSVEYGRTHSIERVVFSMRDIEKIDDVNIGVANGWFSSWKMDSALKNKELYRVFERNVVTNTWSSSQFLYDKNDESMTTIYEKKHHKYQPIYVSFYAPRSGNKLGDGMGLHVLPALITINNMLQSLEEAAYSTLVPTIVAMEGQIDTQKQQLFTDEKITSALGCRILVKSANSITDHIPIQELPNRIDPSLTLRMVEEYKRGVLTMLSPNRMILAKGESGMSVQETQLRDSYDRVSISNKAAAIVDDVLIPLIKYMLYSNKSDLPAFKFKTMNENKLDIMDFKIRVRNVTGVPQTSSRIRDLTACMSLLGQAAQLKQAGIDSSAIMTEASNLFSVSIENQTGENTVLADLLQLASEKSQNNIVNKATV
ncbi:MAG: hypothetical protein ACRCST_11635 [Turicibacter sp.]